MGRKAGERCGEPRIGSVLGPESRHHSQLGLPRILDGFGPADPFRIPTGFRPPAQGCRAREATLGHHVPNRIPTATRLRRDSPHVSFCNRRRCRLTSPGRNRGAVVPDSFRPPGVGPRSSGQPRAGGLNAVGVAHHGAHATRDEVHCGITTSRPIVSTLNAQPLHGTRARRV